MGECNKEFEQLYESTKHSLLRFIASKCINICDIDDIYQETYARVYDALSKGKSINDPEAFVIGVAKHCIAHYYSLLKRLRSHISISTSFDSSDSPELADDMDIEQLIADKDTYSEVFNEICTQPSDVQRIFYLHFFLDLPLNQTAKLLDMNENAAKQKLYKAIRTIRRKYTRRNGND